MIDEKEAQVRKLTETLKLKKKELRKLKSAAELAA